MWVCTNVSVLICSVCNLQQSELLPSGRRTQQWLDCVGLHNLTSQTYLTLQVVAVPQKVICPCRAAKKFSTSSTARCPSSRSCSYTQTLMSGVRVKEGRWWQSAGYGCKCAAPNGGATATVTDASGRPWLACTSSYKNCL